MTTTARKYTPAEVSALSDRELGVAVARTIFGLDCVHKLARIPVEVLVADERADFTAEYGQEPPEGWRGNADWTADCDNPPLWCEQCHRRHHEVAHEMVRLDCNSAGDMRTVVEHMRQQWEKIPEHIWWDINDGERSNEWSVRVMHVESSYGPGELAEVHHASLGRAVMEAALLASQVLRS